MKTYRRMSPNQSLDRFLLGEVNPVEWFRFEIEACMYLVQWDADKDGIRPDTLEYEIEFSHKLWDFEIAITGRAHT